MNKTDKTLWSRFSQFAAWCTQQLLDAVAAISGFYYSHKYAAIARRLGYWMLWRLSLVSITRTSTLPLRGDLGIHKLSRGLPNGDSSSFR